DRVLVDDDRLLQSVGLDVGDELVELGAFHQRKEVREGVKAEFLIRGGRLRIFGTDLAGRRIIFPKVPDGRRRRGLRFSVHALAASVALEARPASAVAIRLFLKASSWLRLR